MGTAKALGKGPVARSRVKAIVCSKPFLAVGRSCLPHSEHPDFKKIQQRPHQASYAALSRRSQVIVQLPDQFRFVTVAFLAASNL